MTVLLLDNYDSFTYNLAHQLRGITGSAVTVVRNDKVTEELLNGCTHLVLSPGPGLPQEAGQMMSVLKSYRERLSILGVCLGHQAIACSFGGSLENLEQVVHGKEHDITVVGDSRFFGNISSPFRAARYHSWVVDEATLPPSLKVTARGPNQEIMAIEHETLPIYGVQFHPESILTAEGGKLIRNWLAL